MIQHDCVFANANRRDSVATQFWFGTSCGTNKPRSCELIQHDCVIENAKRCDSTTIQKYLIIRSRSIV